MIRRLFCRARHCLVCNVAYPKDAGVGHTRSYCSHVHEGLAWSDWIHNVRTCRFLVCNCPGDRWHQRLACRRPRVLLGRCIDCGHYRDAHRPRGRRGSSFSYTRSAA